MIVKNSISYRKQVKILRSFKMAQHQKFESFLKSDFFNISPDVKFIFRIINKKLNDPSFIGFKKSDLEILFSKKKNSKKYDPKIAMACNDAIEKFLIQSELNQEEFSQKHLLTKAYNRLGFTDYLKKAVSQTISELKTGSSYNQDFHLKNFLLQEAIYFHPDTNKQATAIKSQEEMIESLDAFFYMTKLHLGLELKQRKNFVDENKQLLGLDKALIFAKKSNSLHFQFYALLLELIDSNEFDEKAFLHVKNTFEQQLHIWDQKDRRHLFQFLINYVTSFINENNEDARSHQFNLFKIGLENEIFIGHNNTITAVSFINIVTIFTNFKKFEEVENVINDYQKYLPKSDQKATIEFSRAYVAMAQEDFKNAISILQTINSKSSLFKLLVRCYLLRNSFEQCSKDDSYSGVFIASIPSFLNYIKKEESLSVKRKKAYLNFGQIVKSIFKISKMPQDKINRISKIIKLKQTISNPNYLILMKPWLLEKINDL